MAQTLAKKYKTSWNSLISVSNGLFIYCRWSKKVTKISFRSRLMREKISQGMIQITACVTT